MSYLFRSISLFVLLLVFQSLGTETYLTEQVDDIKVVREGLDVFDDWWLSAGPLTLYITWGFLDAFIQNYVGV